MDKSKYLQPRQYEMLSILLPDQGEEETAAMITAVQAYITDQGGTIDSAHADSPWGRRRLAYTIRHEGVDYRDGHYVLVYFTALPTAIAEIEREMRLDVNVIRYLLLAYDPDMGEKIDPAAVEAEDEAESADDGADAEATTMTEESAEVSEEADDSAEVTDETEAEADAEEADVADSEDASDE